MPDVARVRISRVRLKHGADVHILARRDGGEIEDRIRSLANAALEGDAPVDAFFAIAFRWHEDEPGNPSSTASWWTNTSHIPARLFTHFALKTVDAHIDSCSTEHSVMRDLGYEPDDGAC